MLLDELTSFEAAATKARPPSFVNWMRWRPNFSAMQVQPLQVMQLTCGCSWQPSRAVRRIYTEEIRRAHSGTDVRLSPNYLTAISPKVNPVSRNFIPVQVSQRENVHVTGLHPWRVLCSGRRLSKKPFRFVVYLNVNAGRARRLPRHIVVPVHMDTSVAVSRGS